MEMAFAASLLLGTWGALYRALTDQYADLVEEVEQIRRHDAFQSQVLLEDLPDQLNQERRKWRFWWWCGLASSVVTALGIYVLAWCIDPRTEVSQWIWLIAVAPFVGLGCMMRMFYLGKRSNRNIRRLTQRLKSAAEKLGKAARQAQP